MIALFMFREQGRFYFPVEYAVLQCYSKLLLVDSQFCESVASHA